MKMRRATNTLNPAANHPGAGASERPRPFLRQCFALLIACAVVAQALLPAAASSRPPARPGPASGTQATETITVFGPERFTRQPGQPTTATRQFSLPAGAKAPFTLQVQNGDADGSNRVSSATVHLNGEELLKQKDFNQNVAALNRGVTLAAANALEVRITSAPGSHLTISFTATRAVEIPPPALESIGTPHAVQGQTLQVALQGRNTHWAQGQTRASFGGEISVGGGPAGEPGLVTVTSPTTAVADLTVSPTAALSPRGVRVTTPPQDGGQVETVSLSNVFRVAAVSPPGAASATVTTIAGQAGAADFADGAGAAARFRNLTAIAVGPDDSVYVADAGNHRVRAVRELPNLHGALETVVSTLAGDGVAGFADGAGATARFNNPQGVAVDAAGAVLVADTDNHRVRRIAPDGTVSTVAGDGTPGFQNGAGAQARFNAPRGVAVDTHGQIYVADTGNAAVRVISTAGEVRTAAGDGTVGAADSPGARFDGLAGVAADGERIYVYLADTGNHRIRRLDASDTVITIAGAERGFADGAAGQARFAEPSGIAVDGAGKVVVADAVNSLVRQIDPELAAGGSPNAVTTLAGTGERSAADGAGSEARFHLPRGVAVAKSSAVLVADTGNHTLRRILLPPALVSITPASARPLATVTLGGERFDARAPERNTVRFTRSAAAGGGQTVAQVTAATRRALTVVVPADVASGPVTVQTDGGLSGPLDFELAPPPAPAIHDFDPKRGPVGATVTLTGVALRADTGETAVTFAGAGGVRLPALVSFASETEVRATVPNGALTGPIRLTNAWGAASTAEPFTVEAQQDFQLTVAPSSATAVQRATAVYVLSLTSAQSTFSQLGRLSAAGLPAGVRATFEPEQITAGAHSTLSVSLADVNLPPGSYPFTLSATADVEGRETVRTASATLNVAAAGRTTLSGRVLNTDSEPVIGAVVSLDGRTATTDASGSFLLFDITAGQNRPVTVDGRTASSPNRSYPLITEPANVVAGQANVVPFIFYLPPIDVQAEVEVVPGQTTAAGNARVPGLVMMIPPDANLKNRDGSPVTRVSITPLPPDRTPAPLPSNVSADLVYTSQPGGALTSVQIPVIYPNLSGDEPGARIELYAFNHDIVEWYRYGYGRVSADGRTIEPEVNPATGRLYGLRDFSWHFPNAGEDGDPGPDDEGDCGEGDSPVDYTTGNKLEMETDVSFGGARGGITLARVYTSDMSGAAVFGRFGRGFKDNFDVRLTGSWNVGGAGRLLTPSEQTGRLFSYVRTDPDGARVFATAATRGQLGDFVRRLPDGTFEYRYSDGFVMRFDTAGRLASLSDRNGNTTRLEYTGADLTRIVDPVNRAVRLEYVSVGSNRLISRVIDPLNRSWRYEYEGFGIAGGGFLARVTDPTNQVVRYAYGANARLSSVTDPRGAVVKQLTYDGNGRVTQQKFADGGVERYQYTLAGRSVSTVAITDAAGRVTTRRFNSAGYLVGETDPLGQSSRVERAIGSNLPVSNSGPCGCAAEATRQFDARGNVTAETDRSGKSIRVEYEATYNRPTKVTDKLDRVSTFGYDGRGNVTTVTNSLNQTTTYGYDAFGQLTSVTDHANRTVRVEYDAHGFVTAVVDEMNRRSTIEVDILGRVTAVADPLGRRSTAEYDDLDRLRLTKDSAGAVTRLGYDANSNPTTVTDALDRVWRVTYDAKNRPVRLTEPGGRVSRWQYNAADEVTSSVSPLGRTVRYAYDARGQVTTATDPSGGKVRYAYNAEGDLTSLTDQRGQVTTYIYDEYDRLTESRSPLGQASRAVYDDGDNLTEAVDWQGRRTGTTYDALDRPVRASFADAVVDYTFDERNRLRRLDDSEGGFAEWVYDEAGRTLSETTPAGTVSYTYNEAGQRLSMTAAGRPAVAYGYDDAGRLQTITQGAEVFTFGYDTLSRLQSLQRPNGIKTTYAYDTLGRLERLTHADAAGGPIEDFRYTYTPDDELASVTSLLSSTRLPAPKSAAPANELNQVAQVGDSSYTFDAEGQQATKSTPQGTTSYQWDARGRLRQVSLPGGRQVSYGYDALGRLATRAADGQTTGYLYDLNDVVLDRAGDGSTVSYLNGPGVDSKLRQSSAATGPLYFLDDHLGSTVALTNASGVVVETMQYEAFGLSAGSALTRYGFTGRELDSLTGLVHMRARWYDPEQGRFISEDPAGFGGGLNLYRYASNNPLSFVDPFGMQDGPRSPLRDPVAHDAWYNFGGLTNGLSNTLNDLVGGDRVADLSWTIGDHRRPALERVGAAAELAGHTAELLLTRRGGKGGPRGGPRGGPSPRLGGPPPPRRPGAGGGGGRGGGGGGPASCSLTGRPKGGGPGSGGKSGKGGKGGKGGDKPAPRKRDKKGWKEKRDKVLDGNPDCVWCRKPASRNGRPGHADHKNPHSKGGSDELDNLQPACEHCNTSRGNRDFPKTPPKDYTGPWPGTWPPWPQN